MQNVLPVAPWQRSQTLDGLSPVGLNCRLSASGAHIEPKSNAADLTWLLQSMMFRRRSRNSWEMGWFHPDDEPTDE